MPVREHIFDPLRFERSVFLIPPERLAVRWTRVRLELDAELVASPRRQTWRQFVREHIRVLRKDSLAQRVERSCLWRRRRRPRGSHRAAIVGTAKQRRQRAVADVVVIVQLSRVELQDRLHQLRRCCWYRRAWDCKRDGVAAARVVERNRARREVDYSPCGHEPR